MTFADRLWKIRDAAGISQEHLAEKLNVSRQAVAKWESGISMPDIDNLVRISDFFQVTLDYLLKKSICSEMVSEPSYDTLEIINFTVEAKKNTYASPDKFNAARVASSRLGSKDLAYEAGDFNYLDTYVGSANFSGSEVVYHKDIPMWSMNYMGHTFVEETSRVIGFLTDALGHVTPEMPYRGPTFYRVGKYTYVNSVSGDFDWFQGVEKIYYQEELVYELVYHGGAIR